MTPPVIAVILAGLFGLLNALLTFLASRKNSGDDISLKRRAADTLDKDKIEKARDDLHKEMLDFWRERIAQANERADEEKARADKLQIELDDERAKHAPKVEPIVTDLPNYAEVSTSRIEL